MRVRCATLLDFSDVEYLLEEFLEKSLKEYGVRIEKSVLEKTMNELVESSLVLEDGRENVVGVLAGKVIGEPMSGAKIFQEVVWYVLEKYRRYGLLLLEGIETWCRVRNISTVVMVHMGNSMPEKLARFYERKGYKHMECHYMKRV